MEKIYRQSMTLTEEAATVAIAAAREQAQRLGVPVCVAVVDVSARLVAYTRMDQAPLLSETIAQDKAYTAAAFGLPTDKWYPMIAENPALLHGIVHTPRLVIFAGGLPIQQDGHVVGAVGVSGGTAEQDLSCAAAAVTRLTGESR